MIFLTWGLAFFISTLVVTIHVGALKNATHFISKIGTEKKFHRRFMITSYILLLHWVEIAMFGTIYYLLVEFYDIGMIHGAETLKDYFYFSATNYTTLGYGDLYPEGDIRIFSGIEALVGLIIIGWTIAFTFNFVTTNDSQSSL